MMLSSLRAWWGAKQVEAPTAMRDRTRRTRLFVGAALILAATTFGCANTTSFYLLVEIGRARSPHPAAAAEPQGGGEESGVADEPATVPAEVDGGSI